MADFANPGARGQHVEPVIVTGNTLGSTSSMPRPGLSISAAGLISAGFSNSKLVLSGSQSSQSAIKGLGASNTGNTAGNTGLSTGIDWVIAGSNGITISESTVGGGPDTLWVSGITQSNQSAIKGLGVSNTGNTAGNTGLSTGIDWVVAASNNITVSESTTLGGPNTIWVSGANAGAAQYSVGVSTGGNTSGNTGVTGTRIVFSATNAATWSQATDATGATLGLSVPQTSSLSATGIFSISTNGNTISMGVVGQVAGLGVSNTGNTAGNTGTSSGNWVIAGSNGITASESTVGGGPNTVWISGATQTNQSAIKGLGASNTGNTAGNTGLSTGIDWVIAGSNGITISESTVGGGPDTLWISGTTYPAQSNQSAIKGLGVSNTGNTAGNTGLSTGIDWVIAGSNGITASESTAVGGPNTIWLSGNTQSTGNVFASSNTFGTSSGTYDVRTLSIEGSGAIFVAASNSGWIISNVSGGVYAVGDTSGTSSGTYDYRTLSISGVGSVQIAASNSGFNIGLQPLSFFEPIQFMANATATSSGGIGTLHVFPFVPEWPVSFAQVNVIVSNSLTSTTAANTMTVSMGGNSSVVFQATFSNTNSQFIDMYLFSKGTGGFSSNIQTWASSRNSIVTFQTHTYQLSESRASVTIASSVSLVVSFPAVTSGTTTSINAATTVTTYGLGYSSWTSSIVTSNTTTIATGATGSFSLAGTWPATTAWSSFKLLPLQFATIMQPGEYWIGFNLGSSTSSSSSTASTNGQAGATFTSSINASNLTLSAQLTYMGFTNSVSNSLGVMGTGALATLAPSPGHGSFSATYSPASTYLNNAGQPNGAIGFSQINTDVSFYRHWLQFANTRI